MPVSTGYSWICEGGGALEHYLVLAVIHLADILRSCPIGAAGVEGMQLTCKAVAMKIG